MLFCREKSAADDAARAAFERLAQLDSILSDYRLDSELNRLCARAGAGPVQVGNDLFIVLKTSLALSHASAGAFDVTIGPAVQLWREAKIARALPSDEALQTARSRMGWRNVVVNTGSRTVELREPGMQLDLGGIGKGYAAQQAVDLLRSRGVNRCLVALAGDIAVGDPPPESERGWRIGIAQRVESSDASLECDWQPSPQPSPKRRGSESLAASRTLLLANAAVSTSGDTAQFIDIDGVRYSHIIDPRTGLGLTAQRTVTVIALRGEIADALASALCVMGPNDAPDLLAQFPGTAAIFEEIIDDELVCDVLDPGGVIDWAADGSE